jgi:type IV pilus assembly protein PilW
MKTQSLKITTKGVTLVELMLAVAISSILMLGVGVIYSNSKRTYIVQDEFGYMEENARVALKYLTEDIRITGFMGCAWNNFEAGSYQNYLNSTGDANTDAQLSRLNVGMEGFDGDGTLPGTAIDIAASGATAGVNNGNWGANLPGFINTNTPGNAAYAHLGSDMLVVRYADGGGIKLAANKESANFWIFADGFNGTTTMDGRECHTNPATGQGSGICEGDILLVTDCEKSRLFQVTNGMSHSNNIPGATGVDGIKLNHAAAGNPEPPGNANPTWDPSASSEDYFDPIDSEILRASAWIYYVATGASGEPALFRQSLRPGSTAQELVEGVENMQVLYGIDTDKTGPNDASFDGIANRYVPANQVNLNADNVVSARISLLMRTSNEIPNKSGNAPVAKTYLMSGLTNASGVQVTAPADWRMRKVFTTTVKIRNKGVHD